MDKSKSEPKKKLTPSQRAEVVTLKKEGWTAQAIADKFGCSTANVFYLLRKDKEKNGTMKPKSKMKKDLSYEMDPIKFRIGKLLEIEGDISFARDERVVHTLPTLHKLHLQVHDELRGLVEQAQDVHGENAEQLQAEIVDAIKCLPPVLKQPIIEELLIDGNNVVRLKP